MGSNIALVAILVGATVLGGGAVADPRARDAGVAPGVHKAGPLNAITDVAGVAVGHVTLSERKTIRTGVTAILPHGGNIFQNKVPAGYAQGNGYGKFAGTTQIIELGEIETPIVLTNTLSVPAAAEGVVRWTLDQPGNQDVRSVNAVVGETNDSRINDIRALAVRPEHAIGAIEAAKTGPVEEGAIGAGAGTVNFGYKGGIGTSSRVLAADSGGYTVGVLVQTNYGGDLHIMGVPVGRILDARRDSATSPDGSVVIIIATDAPVTDRNLRRMAARAFLGLARTGSAMSNGSGDYAVAFSTHPDVRRTPDRRRTVAKVPEVPNGRMTPLFEAVVEATEEAVYNALFAADTVDTPAGKKYPELPVADVLSILKTKNQLAEDK